MGLFGKKTNPDSYDEQDSQHEGTQGVEAPLPSEGPLRNLVRRLHSDDAQGGKLTLIQRGNAMNHQTERNVNGSVEMDSGVVDQNHPLFKDVAELYTTSMSQDVAAWQTLVIKADSNTVQVDYDYASAPHKTETYRLNDAPDEGEPDQHETVSASHANADTVTVDQSQQSEDRESQAVDTAVPAGAGVGSGALAAAAAQGREEQSRAQVAETSEDSVAQPDQDSARTEPETRAEQRRAQQRRVESAERSPAVERAPEQVSAQQAASAPADSTVHQAERAGDADGLITGPAAAAAVAGSPAGKGPDFDAPSVAHGADVAPSYKAQEVAAPSSERLARGNKVLTEVDVVSRLADAQKRLFGDNGTARDVSAVLIRIRTLGSYFDALAHVRRNGRWEHCATFDLVPEEELKIKELKEESYVDGVGAPVAIMMRFRPRIPPEVSFDYADEEAFVRYEGRLPAQNYMEELRNYPRTSANISQHMNDALQDWNF